MGFYRIIIITFCITSVLQGYSIDFNFELISEKQGLSSVEITSVYQAKDGIVYFSSFEGFHIYNGYEIKNLPKDKSNPYRPNVTGVYDYLETDGKIWLAASDGLDIYDPVTGIFESKSEITYQNEKHILVINQNFAIDINKNIYLCSHSLGVIKFNKNGRLLDVFQTVQNNKFNSICINQKNEIWIGSQNGRLLKTDTSFNILEDLSLGKKNAVIQIYNDTFGNIWFGTTKGLFKYDTSTRSIHNFSFLYTKYGALAQQIRGIVQLEDNSLLFGSDGYGLVQYYPLTGENAYYSSNTCKIGALTSNNIRGIYVDHSNGIWIPLFGYGVNYHSRFKKPFRSFDIRNPNNYCPESSIKGSVFSIQKGKNNNLLLATSKGFAEYDIENEIFKTMTFENSRFDYSNISTSIILQHNNKLYLTSYLKGLGIASNDKQIIKYYPGNSDDKNSDVLSQSILYITTDTGSNIWMGYLDGGISCYNTENNTFKHYEKNNLFTLTHDLLVEKDTVWIGAGGRGLIKLNTNTGEFFSYNLPEKKTDPVNRYSVYQIEKDKDGNLWLATQYGLRKFDRKKQKIINYFNDPFLLNSKIKTIVADNDYLWLASQNIGIICLKKSTGKYRVYNESNGISSTLFSANAGIRLENGKIFIGNNNGMIELVSKHINQNSKIPPVRLVGLTILNKPVERFITNNSPDSVISVNHCNDIYLSYDDKSITFEFAALEYDKPDNIQYKYRLVGFDDIWIKTDAKKRFATYTNLPAGEYVFRVKASNGYGLWNEEGLSVNVHVKPPFWKTAWFIGLEISFVLFIIIALYSWRFSIIKKQNQKLEGMVNEQTKALRKNNDQLLVQSEQLNQRNELLEERQQQIEAQTEELVLQKEKISRTAEMLQESNLQKDRLFSIIGHDLKNPIGALMGFLELLIEENDKYDAAKRKFILENMHQATKSISLLLENLLLWARSQTGRINFKPERIYVNTLVDDTLAVLQENALNKKIEIEKHINETQEIYADKNMMQTIIRNIVSNAIKFTSEGGCIKITCFSDAENFICKISDNGIGMPDELQKRIFKNDSGISEIGTKGEKGSGLGLLICKDFIEYHKGEIWVKSQLKKGTTFYFSIPN